MAMKQLIGLRYSFYLLLLISFIGCTPNKTNINIAVASNFEPYLKNIVAKFKSENNIIDDINIISGSSGLLTSQIINGAPFDLFLSADLDKPLIILNNLTSLTEKPKTYAIGKLSLWIPNGLNNNQCINQLKGIKSLAIANPEIAPYGEKAEEIIEKYNIHLEKIINTSNVNQTFIYTKESITDSGFIPYSSLILHKINTGCVETFKSIELQQSMLLLDDKAKKIHDFILSEEIQEYINKSGYNTNHSTQ
jgi:molybdate transport system substrate-binding protein